MEAEEQICFEIQFIRNCPIIAQDAQKERGQSQRQRSKYPPEPTELLDIPKKRESPGKNARELNVHSIMQRNAGLKVQHGNSL